MIYSLCVTFFSFLRDWSRTVTAGHPDETKEGPTGRQPEREDRPETRPYGAGGEEHLACGFHP